MIQRSKPDSPVMDPNSRQKFQLLKRVERRLFWKISSSDSHTQNKQTRPGNILPARKPEILTRASLKGSLKNQFKRLFKEKEKGVRIKSRQQEAIRGKQLPMDNGYCLKKIIIHAFLSDLPFVASNKRRSFRLFSKGN